MQTITKACLAKGQESPRRETAGTTGVGFRNLAARCVGFVALRGRPMFYKLFICTQIAFHSDAKSGEGDDAACGRYVHKSCYQIIGLPGMPPEHALKVYS